MANNNQETLLDDFDAIQRQDAGDNQTVQMLTEGLVEALHNAVAAASGTVHPAATDTAASGGSGFSAGATVESVLEGGLGLGSLVGGLIGLFGGGDSSAPPALVKYAMPTPLDIETAWTPSGVEGADYDQMGMPRAYGGSSPAQTSADANGSSGGAAASAQISVNVQAMDARSFLDRSGDIAAAVRNAMLNLNSINDVVNDL
ncbi:MAG: hypothetical protein ABSC23_08720 [Bryobacteraceae bacterium]|jgi:hypothetical protein